MWFENTEPVSVSKFMIAVPDQCNLKFEYVERFQLDTMSKQQNFNVYEFIVKNNSKIPKKIVFQSQLDVENDCNLLNLRKESKLIFD